MALGIGAIIGGITAIAGAFKKSKSYDNLPAAPSMPELTPEKKQLQSDMTKYAQVDLRNAFSAMTGGMDVDEFVNTQSAIDTLDRYNYLKESARTSLADAANKIIWPANGFPNTEQGRIEQQKAADLGLVMKYMAGVYGSPTQIGGIPNQWDVSNANSDTLKQVTQALGRLPGFMLESVKVNVDGKEYPALDFFSLDQARLDVIVQSNQLAKQKLLEQKALLEQAGGQAPPTGGATPGRYPMIAKDTAASVAEIDEKLKQIDNSIETWSKQSARVDPVNNYYNNPDVAKSAGMTTEQLKRTMADIGLYDPTRQQFYKSIPDAVAANNGKLPTENYNALLMARVAMEAKGDYTSAGAVDTAIKDSNPKFYDKYFDPEEGIWTKQNPLEKYKDPKIEKPSYIKNIEEAIGGSIDKLFKPPDNANTALSRSAAEQYGRAGQLLEQAVGAGAQDQAAASKWMQDQLARGAVSPAEFKQATDLLNKVPDVLATIGKEKTAGLKEIGSLNSLVSDTLKGDWSVKPGQDQRRDDVLNSITYSVTTGEKPVTAGADAYRNRALNDLLKKGQSTAAAPQMETPINAAGDETMDLLRKKLADPNAGVSAVQDPYRKAALDAMLAKFKDPSNPYVGMTDAEAAARRAAAAATNAADLRAGQATVDEQLAKRNAIDSSQGNVERARLLNEIIGQRGTELDKTLEAEYLRRKAEASAQNEAAKIGLLNQMSQGGLENASQSLEAQKFNVSSMQQLAQMIMNSSAQDVANKIQTGQINLDAVMKTDQDRTNILNMLAQAGQQNIETSLQAQQFNATNKQNLVDKILSATDADTQNKIRTGQINVDALVSKVNAANQSASQQAQTLASMIGVTVEQANAILKSAGGYTDAGTARANAANQGVTAMTGVANTASDAATQARNSGINAAKTAADIGTAYTGANESVAKSDANTSVAQTGLLNAITNLGESNYGVQQFNQLQPMETEIAKQNAMTGAMQTGQGIINSLLNQNTQAYQGALNSWQASTAAQVAKQNAKADAWGTVGSVLSNWF